MTPVEAIDWLVTAFAVGLAFGLAVNLSKGTRP